MCHATTASGPQLLLWDWKCSSIPEEDDVMYRPKVGVGKSQGQQGLSHNQINYPNQVGVDCFYMPSCISDVLLPSVVAIIPIQKLSTHLQTDNRTDTGAQSQHPCHYFPPARHPRFRRRAWPPPPDECCTSALQVLCTVYDVTSVLEEVEKVAQFASPTPTTATSTVIAIPSCHVVNPSFLLLLLLPTVTSPQFHSNFRLKQPLLIYVWCDMLGSTPSSVLWLATKTMCSTQLPITCLLMSLHR